MRPIRLVIIIVFVFSSCNPDKYDNLKRVPVDRDSQAELKLSDISEGVQTVILETNESCLLSHIMKVELSNDCVFIYDFSGPKILQFSVEGKFIKIIGSKGRGPGEYPNIKSFATDKLDKNLFVASSKKIISYDFSGAHNNESRHNLLIEGMAYINNELWIITNNVGRKIANGSFVNTKKLYTLNQNLEIRDSVLLTEAIFKSRRIASHPMPFLISDLSDGTFVYAPEMLFEKFLRDTLYKIVEGKLVPYLKFDFESKKKLKDPRRSILIKNIYKSDRYSFLEYNNDKIPYFFVYDQATEETWNTKEGIVDDIYNSGKAILRPLDEKTGLFYFIKDSNNLEGTINGINENDNPVIFIVKLKEKIL